MNVKLKAIGFLWLLFCSTETLIAQQTVLTTGGNISSASGSVSYSIGQVMYNHIDGEIGSLNQGVQQPYSFTIVGIDDPLKETSWRLFPNPADQYVNIQMSTAIPVNSLHPCTARLFDMKGNLVTEKILDKDINRISLSQCTQATYIVQISDQQRTIQSYALIKSN
ncbi:MAG TPA: T9SS type A sorting domain-containing protein [Saprospiraceae bacterium]|nr:T9SS type A sorting domain-containing protein [Saprospiraceae bacterium]